MDNGQVNAFFAEGFGEVVPAGPAVFVLFGVSGDLTARKIAPALYNLANDQLLTDRFIVLGVGRRDWNDDTLRDQMRQAIAKYSRTGIDNKTWESFAHRWRYQRLQTENEADYLALAGRLDAIDNQYATGGRRVFYLAVPGDMVAPTVANLGKAGLNVPLAGDAFTRIVIEKPFGSDLAGAKALNRLLLGLFHERQIYRIDHYLGKETARNMLVFRFANTIFEPLLNRQYVKHVQITAAESVGMEGRRGRYYEQAGALRDMVQNHMLQLLSLVAMDPPACFGCESIRDEKARVLRALRPFQADEAARYAIRGQYAAGDKTPAYTQEEGVAPDSTVETFVALRLQLSNWRWWGVPFYLRTGKNLTGKLTLVTIVFKNEPAVMDDVACSMRGPNRLSFRLTPDEGISLVFDAKIPGVRMMLRPVKMDFRYESSFESASPEAYERLLLDVFSGDQTLFIRNDEVEASWSFIDSIRASWNSTGLPKITKYAPGSWGPGAAERLFDDPYSRWYVT